MSFRTFETWDAAWAAWCRAAGEGGSVVMAELRTQSAPAAHAAAIIDALDAARERAFVANPDGGSVPEVLARGTWFCCTWWAGGRSRVTLSRDTASRDWRVVIEVRERDDGTTVVGIDGLPAWEFAPASHWRWAVV